MLLTLTSLSGFYGISNFMFIKNNKYLLKHDNFLSLRGKKSLGQITIEKNSILYKINYVKDNNFTLYKINYAKNNNFTLNNKILTYQTKKFDSTEECKNFCISNNLNFDNSIYNKIVIDDQNTDNVWMLQYSDKYTIMNKMSNDEFKSQIIKTNQLPLNKLNIILFIVLLIIYYESNK
jgi:hypothetical protein